MPRKLGRDPMQWSCKRERGKCTTHSSLSKGKFEVSFIWRSGSFGWNPMHCFHLSRKTWSGVLCSETLTRRIWEELFLKATRITCSIRRDQTWRIKSFMSSPSTSASVNYNDKRTSKDWRYRTHKTDLLKQDKQVRLQEELSVKEKVLRNTPIQNARNGRNEESSRTTSRWGLSAEITRESYDTIQRVTAQIQGLQERVKCMNDSGKLRIEL